MLYSTSSDNCTWKVEIVDSQLLEMVISEPSNEAYVSGNYLLNYREFYENNTCIISAVFFLLTLSDKTWILLSLILVLETCALHRDSIIFFVFLCLLTAPKPPLLSLACTNQIPVLNWTEVVYGYYNPKRLCVEHTCHSEDNTTVSILVY